MLALKSKCRYIAQPAGKCFNVFIILGPQYTPDIPVTDFNYFFFCSKGKA